MRQIISTGILALLLSFGISCQKEHSGEAQEHAHDTDKETFQITQYDSVLEIFAEAEPFIVGKTSSLLAHFTSPDNFKPLKAASVTALIVTGNKGIRQTVKKPLRPGIYKFKLQPETSGEAKLYFEIKTGTKVHRTPPKDVTVLSNSQKAMHNTHEKINHPNNAVAFTKEQSWKINFKTAYPEKQRLGHIIKTVGLLKTAPNNEKIVSAKTSGIVRFNSTTVLEGTEVKQGQILFSISARETSDNNLFVRYTEAKNNYQKAKVDYEKAEKLADKQIVSQKELRKLQNALENAKALYKNLQKNFTSYGQTVKSPMNGYIKDVFAENGEYAKAGQSLVTVSDNRRLILSADLQQKNKTKITKNIDLNFRFLNRDKIYTLEDVNGKFLSVGKSAHKGSYLIPVHFSVENPGDFTSGSFAEMYIKSPADKDALVIPKEALLEERGKYFVYVQIHPELFEKREVNIGDTDGLNTEILSGLSVNERIVTQGATFVKSAQGTGTLDAHSGHVH